ncbi:hypothetical protein THAOC_22459, partial [Thalassiosira oceanica]
MLVWGGIPVEFQENCRILQRGVVGLTELLGILTGLSKEFSMGAPGTADLPWEDLGFELRTTKSHLRMFYKDGKWGEAELVE